MASEYGFKSFFIPKKDRAITSNIIKQIPSQPYLLYANILSLKNKYLELEHQLNENNEVKLMCFTETWLKNKQTEYYEIPGFKLGSSYCRPDSVRGGGSAIYVHNNYEEFERCKILENMASLSDFEISSIKFKKSNTLVICVYRAPDSDVETFLNKLDECLDKASKIAKFVYIAGDVNINQLLVENKDTVRLNNILSAHGLHATWNKVTRPASESCLDNIFTNIPDIKTEEFEYQFSDHIALKCQISGIKKVKTEQKIIKKRIFTQDGLQRLNYDIASEQFNKLIKEKNCEEAWNFLISSFSSAFPEKEIKITTQGKNKKKIYSSHLKKIRENILTLSSLNKDMSSAILKQKIKKMKTLYKNTLKEERYKCNSEFVKENAKDPKKIWKYINNEAGSGNISKINSNLDAQQLNDHFTDIGKNLSDKLTNSVRDPSSYLEKPNLNSLFLFPTDEEEVKTIISNLNSSTACDYFNISNKLIKNTKDVIAKPLSDLINVSMSEGVFPNCLKNSRVIPIFKKDDPNDPSNFRPISLTPILGKIFEKIIKERLISFMCKFNILNKHQFGFRKGLSTADAIRAITEYIYDAFEKRQEVILLSCDLTKAFDCVCHKILLEKLYHYGIRGIPQSLISSYLNNRTQYTEFKGKNSLPNTITHGVPQGSVLGPILFLLYINDLVTTRGICIKFADDTSFALKCNCRNLLEQDIAEILEEAKLWFTANKLTLNENKNQKLLFTLKKKEVANLPVKLLGVHLETNLSWKTYLTNLKGSLCKALYLLRKIALTFETKIIKLVYYAQFHSRLTYCITEWGSSPHTSEIFICQKKALRIVFNKKWNETCKPLFIEHKILTLPSIYILNLLTTIQPYYHELIQKSHTYETRYTNRINIPAHRLHLTSLSPQHQAVKLINKLNIEMINLPPQQFKKQIKELLLENAFYSVQDFLDYKF